MELRFLRQAAEAAGAQQEIAARNPVPAVRIFEWLLLELRHERVLKFGLQPDADLVRKVPVRVGADAAGNAFDLPPLSAIRGSSRGAGAPCSAQRHHHYNDSQATAGIH